MRRRIDRSPPAVEREMSQTGPGRALAGAARAGDEKATMTIRYSPEEVPGAALRRLGQARGGGKVANGTEEAAHGLLGNAPAMALASKPTTAERRHRGKARRSCREVVSVRKRWGAGAVEEAGDALVLSRAQRENETRRSRPRCKPL